MNVENQIALDKFKLRWYQEEIWDTIEQGKSRKVFYVASRRAGKDILFFNLAVRQCLKKTCLVLYVLKNYRQGRQSIFDAIAIDGTPFLHYIPRQLIESINKVEMKITFKNNSILKVVGAESFDTSIVGSNPYAVIFSEYALMPPNVIDYTYPILAANGGWLAVLGTFRGKNWFYNLYLQAKELPEWKVFLHKASEIKHIPDDVYSDLKNQMDPNLFMQEFECDPERGITGTYYGALLDASKTAGRVGYVPWEPDLLVHTAWDIGVNDPTTIIMFQVLNNSNIVRIIDTYSNNNVGLDHYAKVLQDKPYKYDQHFAPHDIKVREFGGGAISRYEKARQLGINFTLVDRVPLLDGIETAYTHFNKILIDEEKCKSLIEALENYRRVWNDKEQRFEPKPQKSWASHYADAFRYMCLSLHKTAPGMSAEEFEKQKARALYGGQNLPHMFRKDGRFDRYY